MAEQLLDDVRRVPAVGHASPTTRRSRPLRPRRRARRGTRPAGAAHSSQPQDRGGHDQRVLLGEERQRAATARPPMPPRQVRARRPSDDREPGAAPRSSESTRAVSNDAPATRYVAANNPAATQPGRPYCAVMRRTTRTTEERDQARRRTRPTQRRQARSRSSVASCRGDPEVQGRVGPRREVGGRRSVERETFRDPSETSTVLPSKNCSSYGYPIRCTAAATYAPKPMEVRAAETTSHCASCLDRGRRRAAPQWRTRQESAHVVAAHACDGRAAVLRLGRPQRRRKSSVAPAARPSRVRKHCDGDHRLIYPPRFGTC